MILGTLAKLAFASLAVISTIVAPKIVYADSVVSTDMIQEINSKSLWKAEESEFTRMEIEDVKQLMGTVLNKNHQRRINHMLGKRRAIHNHYVSSVQADCCWNGNCCHGMEYCCNECDGSCTCSVNGKCNGLENTNDIKCDVCEFAIGWVESKLPINSTATEVEQLLEEVCNIVPKDFQAGCQELVQNVADTVINAILQKISPPSVCGMIGLCSRKITIDNGLPDNFDGRQAFGKCIHPVRNQGRSCGSCWAFSASEVLSDRFCIATKGAVDVVLSAQTLVSCDTANMGCQGGYLDKAWDYMVSTGLASDACEPYTSGGGDSGTCPKQCADGSAIKYYKAAGYKHLTGSIVGQSTVDVIRQDLMTNGPVQVAFEVYQDFIAYKSGVYHHVSGSLLGGHAVELVGWGVDSVSNMPYWLVKNSWDTTWGDQGYFKILRGKNECGIESDAFSGLPAVNSAVEVDGDIQCDLCMFVSKFAEQELAGDKAEDAIEAVLDKACNFLPKNTQQMCQSFVQAELPNLIQLIVNNATPEKICSFLHAC